MVDQPTRDRAGQWAPDSPHGANLTAADIDEMMGEQGGRGGTPNDLAEAAARRTRAVCLRLRGMSYAEIAEHVGYAHGKSAHRAVTRSLDRVEVENVEALREIENRRLDAAQAAIWDRVLDGDLDAVHAFLRLSKRRAAMNGLDAPRAVYGSHVRTSLATALADLSDVIEAEVLDDDEVATVAEIGQGDAHERGG